MFNGQGAVPAAAAQVLWGLDQQHSSALIEDLAHKSLLRAEDGRISLHDLQMDYLVRCAPDLPGLHDRLLAADRDQCPAGWASGRMMGIPPALAHHLRQAARIPELKALLLDLDWMTAKLAAGTIPGLLADYDTFPAIRHCAWSPAPCGCPRMSSPTTPASCPASSPADSRASPTGRCGTYCSAPAPGP